MTSFHLVPDLIVPYWKCQLSQFINKALVEKEKKKNPGKKWGWGDINLPGKEQGVLVTVVATEIGKYKGSPKLPFILF